MNTHPIISIIVPVFENSNNLRAHLNALQAQTETRWEAHYSFDGDLSHQRQAFDPHHLADPRIHIIQNGKPATIGELLNTSLDAGAGENIILLHAEDALHSNALRNITKDVEKSPTKDYLYFIKRQSPDGKKVTPNQIPHNPVELDEDFAEYGTLYFIYKRSIIHHYNLRFRHTNSASIHEDFTETYTTIIPSSEGIAKNLQSAFSHFSCPPAMQE